MKYKVGDKVKVVSTNYDFKEKYVGKTFTIRSINPNGRYGEGKPHYGVEGPCPFIFRETELAPVSNRKIVITADGSDTLARLYEDGKVIKSATAKCSPEDTFDFGTGAKIAFDRLMEEKKESEEFTLFRIITPVFDFDKKGDILKAHKVTSGGFWVYNKNLPHPYKMVKENYEWCYLIDERVEEINDTEEKEEKEWRVVDRPAKVGDYIRLKHPSFSFNESGNVLKVCRVSDAGSVYVLAKDHPRFAQEKKGGWLYLKDEFEVIEPVTDKEEPKYYNGKVVCIKDDIDLTAGKVYEFKDGKVKDDKGDLRPCPSSPNIRVETLEDGFAKPLFIPYVE